MAKLRWKRGGIDTSDSGTDPGSTDISLNESDIPLTNLKPRERQNVKNLPKDSHNLRSKATTWYRPLPTADDFEMTPMSSSTPKKTVKHDDQIAGPSKPLTESDLIYNKSTSSSDSSLNSTPRNKTTKPLVFPKAKNIPKRGNYHISSNSRTKIAKVGSGIGLGAGGEHQDIFESQIGQAASDPDNPLQQWFHGQFYKKYTQTDETIYEHLLRFDKQSEFLRLSYANSKSWYEREKYKEKLQNLKNSFSEHNSDVSWKLALDDHWDTYNKYFEYLDKELHNEIGT